jgi:ubiquinone biosynthesis protein UbiJ
MLLGLIETFGNEALEFGPQTREKLAKLQGKTMAIEIKTFNRTWYFTSTPEGIELAEYCDEEPDVTLKTTVGAFLKIAKDGIEDAELEPGELEIEGDAIVGQRFATIISNIDIDWEEYIAEKLGDSSARLISLARNQVNDLIEQGPEGVKDMLSKVFQNLASQSGTAGSDSQAVSELNKKVADLEAQIKDLQAKLKEQGNA